MKKFLFIGLVGFAFFAVVSSVQAQFVAGERVKVTANGNNLNVRPIAGTSQTALGSVWPGYLGTVIGGPTSGWWKVRWDIGLEGWSAGGYLMKAVTQTTTPSNTTSTTTPPLPPIATPNTPAAPVLSAISGRASIALRSTESWTVLATDSDSKNLSYTVAWGDGTPNSTYQRESGNSFFITHTYTEVGNKTITVTVSDGQLKDSKSLIVNVAVRPGGTVEPPKNYAPILGEITGPRSLRINEKGGWGLSVTDPGSESGSVNFWVDFGDGKSIDLGQAGLGRSAAVGHIYSKGGAYTFKVTVSDGQLSDIETFQVTVGPEKVKFNAGDSVEVVAGVNGLFVRSLPKTKGGEVVTQEKGGARGRVVEGPAIGDGYVWWKIIWADGFLGWSAENWLVQRSGSAMIENSSGSELGVINESDSNSELATMLVILDSVRNQLVQMLAQLDNIVR
ncbi:MAG: hypothetical protein G01um101420_122 [Parcubacteria group bacterium Gr01-1014_20]|nr:MAG: hypothetical protein G01um101420_122 [Parcubacteria group bacterium Gr01-1014_20]